MEIAAELLAGRQAAGARAIRWLDDGDPRGTAVLREVFGATGKAHLVGITGPPGAGKSTLTNMVVGELRRRGRKVAVVAIDPSSPFTGGAILGDRVRMARHTLDPGVFIRSIGTRGHAGGLARSAHDACLIFDAMGYDVVIVETVGVGQDEIDVVNLAHSTIIVAVPGMGDEVQAVKAGLLEAGEIFVVNKADREGFDIARRQMELMLHLREQSQPQSGWSPPLLTAIANKDEGGAGIVDAIEQHRAHLEATGGFEVRSGRRELEQLLALLRDRLGRIILDRIGSEVIADVQARRCDPYTAADAILARWQGREGNLP